MFADILNHTLHVFNSSVNSHFANFLKYFTFCTVIFQITVFNKEVSEELEASNKRRKVFPSDRREGFSRCMWHLGSTPSSSAGLPASLPPEQALASAAPDKSGTHTEPAFPGYSTLKHAWQNKRHLKPRSSTVAAQPLPQFSHLNSAEKKGRKGREHSSTMASSYLIGDMAEPQTVNHRSISMSECLNL